MKQQNLNNKKTQNDNNKNVAKKMKNNENKEIANDLMIRRLTQNLASKIKTIQQSTLNTDQPLQCTSTIIDIKQKDFFVRIKAENAINDNLNNQQSSISNNKQIITGNGSKMSEGRSPTSSIRSTSTNSAIHSGKALFSATDPYTYLKEEVQQAMKNRKIFTVRGPYQAVRRALLERGWIEKLHYNYRDQILDDVRKYLSYNITELIPLLRNKEISEVCKNVIKSKLLGNYQVDLYWGSNYEGFKDNPDKIKLTLINKFRRDAFSYANKQGLCDVSKSSHWYQIPGLSNLNHPRSYTLARTEDLKYFMNDFYLTAAMSLIKWIINMSETKECKLISSSGRVPMEVFEFAMNECCKFIKKSSHEDIDMEINEASEFEWNQFLEFFYKTVHFANHFKADGTETEESLKKKSLFIYEKLKNYCPALKSDGIMNIWILKPSIGSRGIGIHVCRTLRYILNTVKNNNKVRYIAQKYIERPLLIYSTKFDIRQWFLISNATPLTIWIYKQSYLRFSSQTYNLRKLHESVHLTNNSIQAKYKNNSHDIALPDYNMWDSREFQNYLSNIGYPNVYHDIIFPGMKQGITAAILMHEEKIDARRNCFELYGADFILTEDFKPWLLEINSNPALFGSTPVTSRLCPQVLEDVIKVVVDYAQNPRANTGEFELMYKATMHPVPFQANLNLELKGIQLNENYFYTPEHDTSLTVKKNSETKPEFMTVAEEEITKTLNTLLQFATKGNK